MAQSYRARPDQLRPLIERNLKLIRDGFAPTAYFIDVWSSMAPYDYWTDSGEFVDRTVTRRAWGEDFAWIRDYLGNHAPQISEAGHDQLIGWLDGAQANHLRVDPGASGFTLHVKAAAAERIPWLDAAYHERFILHGAGYPDRYAAGLPEATHGIYSDDYIATEVLTGHPAMVSQPFSRDVVRKYWLLNDLMRALAGRRIESVEFVDGDIHHQHVRWEGGGEVWVNRGESDWTVADNHRLPPYGFYASVREINGGEHLAAIERVGTGVKEWSSHARESYVNSRGSGVGYRWNSTPGGALITPLPDSESWRSDASAKHRIRVGPGQTGDRARCRGSTNQAGQTGSGERAQILLRHERGVFAYRRGYLQRQRSEPALLRSWENPPRAIDSLHPGFFAGSQREFGAALRDRLPEYGMTKVRGKLRQWIEHKQPLVHARMRDDQIVFVDDQIPQSRMSRSMLRGPLRTVRTRPSFCSMASKWFSNSRGVSCVSICAAAFRNQSWSGLPTGSVR
jgi:hypothetical protein